MSPGERQFNLQNDFTPDLSQKAEKRCKMTLKLSEGLSNSEHFLIAGTPSFPNARERFILASFSQVNLGYLSFTF